MIGLSACSNITSLTKELLVNSQELSQNGNSTNTIGNGSFTETRELSTPSLTDEFNNSIATPYMPLSPTGPYLAYFSKTSSDTRELTILNHDTSGRKRIALPKEAEINLVYKSLSPDGEWLAFHTGSAELSGKFDLALNLLHIPDGKIFTITKLLSPNYPNNFDELTQYLIDKDPYYAGAENIDDVKKVICELFSMGIKGFQWSPNSRFLAFSGEMDGPSSDLYIYDTQDLSINRLTDGLGQMTGEINWSEDGRWILHSSTNSPIGIQWTPEIYAVSVDGSETREIVTSMSSKWISKDTILLSEQANGLGKYNLRTYNIDSNKLTILWAESYNDYAVLGDGSVAVCIGQDINQTPEPGIYIIQSYGQRRFIPANYAECSQLSYRGNNAHLLVFEDPYQGYHGVSKDGEITRIRAEGGINIISPDYNWMLITCHSSKRENCPLDLFDENDKYIRSLVSAQIQEIIWRPDSVGIYYYSVKHLYYLSILDGEPIVIDENLVVDQSMPFGTNIKWVM